MIRLYRAGEKTQRKYCILRATTQEAGEPSKGGNTWFFRLDQGNSSKHSGTG